MTALDEPAAPPAGPVPLARAERVAAAVAEWTDELAALGGRDPLLHFRDLKVGTLDLAAAEPEARKRLLEGEPVTVTRLFPHEPLRSSGLRSVHAIRDKARELQEEAGLAACVLAVGIATWADPFSAHRPTAPVLLRPARVTARDPAETDFVVEVVDEPEVNPVLLNALDAQVGLRFEPDDLRDRSGELRYPVVVERLREFAPAHVVDGFSIAHRAVLGTFTKEPLSLALDLAALGPTLDRHDVIAALAGDAGALSAPTMDPSGPVDETVLDADWSQRAVVATIMAGSHMRVDAPPGTGRTQTVANMVAGLVGQGKTVLVVSPKQARLRELVSRLAAVGLGDLVLDLTDGRTSSPEPVRQVANTARRIPDEPRDAPAPEPVPEAEALGRYCDALHRPREPWGTSAYDAMVALVEAPLQVRTTARILLDALRALDGPTSQTTRERLREYAELEGLSVGEEDSAWYGSTVPTRKAAEFLAATVTDLRETGLPVLRDTATRAAVEVGLSGPQTAAECFDRVTLLNTVGTTLDRFGPEIWTAPLDDMVAATADRRWRGSHGSNVGLLARRRLRQQAHSLLRDPRDRGDLHKALLGARDQLTAWREHARDGRQPRIGTHLTSANVALEAVGERLAALIEANPRTVELADLPFAETGRRLAALAADEHHLLALPRLTALRAELSAAGLDDLIEVLRERGMSPDRVVGAFDYARHRSLLEAWRDEDPALRTFDRVEHERLADAFRTADPGQLRAAVARVRAARARRFAATTEAHEGQAVVVESGEHGPRTPRELLVAAPDVSLAAMPCWAVSPFVVASALPARQLFDVVIVEDADRLPVAHAVPALARARSVVLVGDGQELTGAPFITAVEPDIERGDPPVHGAQKTPLSLFAALDGRLPSASLSTSYRARDDRLVGFPARVSYRGRLVPVPGIRGPSPLRREQVETPAGEEPVDSAPAEVARVVELVLEHARKRPYESLGVVTLGSRHAGRIDDALRRALVRSLDTARFIREDREEPFFVKDAERAVGDVRDAIILSLGYGRSVDGRILYRFGALDRTGGDQLLCAVIAAARERLTVVAAFGADDLSPRRLTTPGAQALRDLLSYVDASAELVTGTEVAGDPLEAAISDRLRAAGADVVLGHGTSGGRIPLAVRHPTRKDRLVLAVETDGPGYASRPTVRERDRLRTEQLTRLGWTVHRVWSTAWIDDPDAEMKRLLAAYERAVKTADAYDWAEAAAQADGIVGTPDEEAGVVDVSVGASTEDGSDDEAPPRVSKPERGPRPPVSAGRPIGTYTRRELAALARWVDADGVARTESEVIDELGEQLGLPDRGPRAEDALRYAVRVARAGAPPLS